MNKKIIKISGNKDDLINNLKEILLNNFKNSNLEWNIEYN